MQQARALACAATRADRACSPDATDLHYQATIAAWQALTCLDPASRDFEQASEIYHASLARFLVTARDDGRFVPGQGVNVQIEGRPIFVPLAMHGFVWQSADVQSVYPVGKYRTPALSRHYQCCGWGVPIVAERACATGAYREENFLAPGAVFAATALLRPSAEGNISVLELFDPLRPLAATAAGVPKLATDISAPIALREVTSPELANGWIPFVGRDSPIREGLFLLEPYQPGKIPVVMIHGLLSSPMSWVDLANDLRAIPEFSDHFQLWGFRYATGKPFLEAAARLRRELYRVVETVDPTSSDPALQNIVLIGHSMGGLVAQLQVTGSENLLWNAIANRPLDTIVAPEQTREELRELFYFAPQPNVKRVIFLATPHEGSSWATRPIGQLGAMFARRDQARVARHEQLRQDNPGVFTPEAERRVPTSIDMLNPESALLQAMACLPRSPCVRFHTVYGYGHFNLCEGPGDGIVGIESAVAFPGVESELGVRAKHTTVHRQFETAEEVARILCQHRQAARSGPGWNSDSIAASTTWASSN